MKRGHDCAYCPSPAVEREHVFPRAMLVNRSRGVLVPTCRACNDAKSKSDEYLLTTMVLRRETWDLPELLEQRAKMERAAFRAHFPGPARKILLNCRRRDCFISGVQHQDVTTVIVDGDTISEAFSWIVRGLYFHHQKLRLPWPSEIAAYGQQGSEANRAEFGKYWPLPIAGDFEVGDCIRYKAGVSTATNGQVWLFAFYNRVFVRVMVNEDVLLASLPAASSSVP